MYQLRNFCRQIGLPALSEDWAGDVICIEADAQIANSANETQGHLSGYIFTLVTRGRLTILYNDREITLHEGDLYTYSPGFALLIRSSSPDYRALCFLADEHFTLSLPSVRQAVRAAYFPVVELQRPHLTLPPNEYHHLRDLMQLALRYQRSDLPNSAESLRLIYSLFLTDLSGIQERSIQEHRFPKRVEELFIGFLRLLTAHFVEHHDVGFYAARLCITTTYLSRIVRQVSGGRTVVDYVNQMLVMEAMYLLRQTSLSVAQIAERLHFADTATLSRFFVRMRGMTPRSYRSK